MRGQGRLFRRKHSGSWWISYYHHGQEIRESAKTTSEHKARALLRERLRTAGTQEFIGPAAQRVTFEDLAVLYLTDYRLNGRRSLRDATRNVETLREVFGIDRALDITSDRIAAYTERRLEAGLKPASVNRELAALRRMFTLAIRAGKIATRPHIAQLAEDNAREGFPRARRLRHTGARLAAWLAGTWRPSPISPGGGRARWRRSPGPMWISGAGSSACERPTARTSARGWSSCVASSARSSSAGPPNGASTAPWSSITMASPSATSARRGGRRARLRG